MLSPTLHTLITGGEKYSHLRLGITAAFHSGAFFKTPNYSFVEGSCDMAQALTGCFNVWQAKAPANQSTNPRVSATKYLTGPTRGSIKPPGPTGQ